MKHSMISVVAIAAICLCFGSPAFGVITVDFEGTLPSNVYLQGFTNGTATLSTDYAHSPTHSAQLYLSSISDDEARVKIANVGGTLGTTAASYWAYAPAGATITNAPYLEFYIDTNNNGIPDTISPTGDSYIITSPSNPLIPGQWVQRNPDPRHASPCCRQPRFVWRGNGPRSKIQRLQRLWQVWRLAERELWRIHVG